MEPLNCGEISGTSGQTSGIKQLTEENKLYDEMAVDVWRMIFHASAAP